jgi:hypothetical protein
VGIVSYLKSIIELPVIQELLAVFVIAGIVYVALLFMLRVITVEELSIMWSQIKNKTVK